MTSPASLLPALNGARDIVLKDATHYSQVVPGVLGVIGSHAALEIRRWGSDFLAETFASPVLAADEKQKLCLGVLDTLESYLKRKELLGEEEDASVVKSAVQCAASIYPLVFRHTVENKSDSETWRKMAGIKGAILRSMDSAPAGVRICCIKFVARVVQVQTPGFIADANRPENNETSLALVPRDHPVMPPNNLEAEASGLLDRLLGVLQENVSDPLVVTAMLNSLSTLVQIRATISPKILNAVLNFNPLINANAPMSGKGKVGVRSMTRTTMSFLLNVLKRNPNHPLAVRIQRTVERLRQSLSEVFSESAGKRHAPDEPIDGLNDAKRRRVDESAVNGTAGTQRPAYTPLPPGPVTYAQLYTISQDASATNFDARALPHHLVEQLASALLAHVDAQRLEDALNVVRKRYLEFTARPPAPATDAARAVTGEEEDDDYDPSIAFPDAEQVINRLDQSPPEGYDHSVAFGPFRFPTPPPLNEEDRAEYSKTALVRVFGTLATIDQDVKAKGTRKQEVGSGFNRAIGGVQSRDGWITLVTRLATRPGFDLEDKDGNVKKEENDRVIVSKSGGFQLAAGIRQALMNYVMEDFRRRIDVAIAWLSEEWYANQLAHKLHSQQNGAFSHDLPNYWYWTLRLLDAMTPYFDVKDGRILIRFLSEIPALNEAVMERVQRIAQDPERVPLCTQALLYLIMLRPPVREMCIDAAERMWRENADAKTAAVKILTKWRPSVLGDETARSGSVKPESS